MTRSAQQQSQVVRRQIADRRALALENGVRDLTFGLLELEDLLFDVPEGVQGSVVVDPEMVERRLQPILGDRDLSRFIL